MELIGQEKDDFKKTIENTKQIKIFIDALEKMLEELDDIYTGTGTEHF